MNTTLKKSIRYRPLAFFLTSCSITWLFWLLAKYCIQLQCPRGVFELLMLAGLCAPCGVAITLITTSKNKALQQLFLNKLFNLRLINTKTLWATITIPPISMIVAILISMLFGFSANQFHPCASFSFSIGIFPIFLLLFLVAILEELGWRGYGMESLFSHFSYFKATAIFSLLWALWHIPLFLIENTYQYNILHQNIFYGINFILSIIPLSFIISWLCKANNNSIIVAIFFHFLVNITQEFFQVTPATKCIQTVVLFSIAIIIVHQNKKTFFHL